MLNERARFRLHHPASAFRELIEAPAGRPDVDLAQRVIAAYNRRPRYTEGGPVWEPLLTGYQCGLIKSLETGDAVSLAEDLAALGRSQAAKGFFAGEEQHRKCGEDSDFAELLALWTYDKLLSLCEAIGVVRPELPEAGTWGNRIKHSPEALVRALEQRLGLDLKPPANFGGYLGIPVGSYALQMRTIEAIYAAFRLKQLMAHSSRKRVCEIGAGAGLTAYYAMLFGIEEYTIVDLPSMNAVQGYVLGGSPVGASVVLEGENPPAGRLIRIISNDAFAELQKGSIDLLFNQDSLPEIEPRAAHEYICDAARLAVPRILSINQEANLPTSDGEQRNVRAIMDDTNVYILESRHRHWLRQGYLEELYSLKRA